MIRLLYEKHRIYRTDLINNFTGYYLENSLHLKFDDKMSTLETYILNKIYYYLLNMLKSLQIESRLFTSLDDMMDNENDPSSDFMVKDYDGVWRVRGEILPDASWARPEYKSQEWLVIDKEISNFCEGYILKNYGRDYLKLFKGELTQIELAEKLGITRRSVNRNLNNMLKELLDTYEK